MPSAVLSIVAGMVCAHCGGTEFYLPTQPSSCKACARAKSRARYLADPASALAAARERQRRPEVRARTRELRQAAAPPAPCTRCGGRKPRGMGRKLCEACEGVTWEELHPERVRDMKRRDYEQRSEARRARDRARSAKDPAGNRARVAAWRKANPEAARRLDRATQGDRRARLMGALVEHIDPEVVYLMHGGCCGLCHEYVDRRIAYPDPRSFSVDHVVPLSRGGEHGYANVQPAHLVCNVRKGASCPT